MKSKREKQPIKFERKRLVITAVYLVLALTTYQLSTYVPDEHRYVYQGFITVGSVFLILFFRSAWKLFTREIRLELYQRISEAMFNAGKRWRAVKKKIREKLGLKERTFIGGSDERHIVFDSDIRRGRRKRAARQKYTDMTTNRERIRFLWAKYIISFAKQGMQPSVSQTPDEIKDSLEVREEMGEALFGLYYTARYAPDNVTIDDHDVNDQAEFVGTKGRL